MEVKDFVVTDVKDNRFHLIGIGDIHLGSVGCDIKHLKDTIEVIRKNDHYYWLGMGDYMECINYSDKRFDPKSIDPSYHITDLDDLISKQYTDMLDILSPIKHKCIALLTGNHEETIRKKYHRDITKGMCIELGVKHLGYNGFIRIKCKKITYTVYAHHGYGASRSSGAKINKLQDVAKHFDADIIMMGHDHTKAVTPPVTKIYCPRDGALRTEERKQLGVMTGSFLKGFVIGYSTYVETAGYGPTDLGVVKITMRSDRFDVHAAA